MAKPSPKISQLIAGLRPAPLKKKPPGIPEGFYNTLIINELGVSVDAIQVSERFFQTFYERFFTFT